MAARWRDIERQIAIESAETDRVVPVLAALAAVLALLRKLSGDGPDDFVSALRREHWTEDDWRNFRKRHFLPALERVEAMWEDWRGGLSEPERVREGVTGLAKTRPYDLGRHTHSALMLAGGMSLQRLARIQGHSIRVLDETCSEELAEFQERDERIDPASKIMQVRALVWGERDPSTGVAQRHTLAGVS